MPGGSSRSGPRSAAVTPSAFLRKSLRFTRTRISGLFGAHRDGQWRVLPEAGPFLSARLFLPPGARFVELELQCELPWAETGRYRYSKVYFATEDEPTFTDDRVTCFRLTSLGRPERVRLELPGLDTGRAMAAIAGRAPAVLHRGPASGRLRAPAEGRRR